MYIKPAANYITTMIGKGPRLLRKGLTRLGSVSEQTPADLFSRSELPVLNCAGSFRFNANLRDGIKGVDLSKVKIMTNSKTQRIAVVGHPKLTQGINQVIKKVPELFKVFQDDTLAEHVLKAYQKLVIHPEFQKLSPRFQHVLELAVINHDTGKVFGLGKAHPERSAKIIEHRYKNSSMPKEDIDLAAKLARHHHFTENVAKGLKTHQYYAEIFTEPEFNLLKIHTDVDLASKRKDVGDRLTQNEVIFAKQEALYGSMRENRIASAKPFDICA